MTRCMPRLRWRWLAPAAFLAVIAGCVPEPAPAPPAAAAPTSTAGAIVDGEHAGFAASYAPLFDSDADLAQSFDLMAASGAKWVRISFQWSSVQSAGPDSYNWAILDRGVNAARARGMHVLANAAYTPAWARPAGATSDKVPPADPTTYANFVAAAVARYAPLGVKHWEIWNEPNTPQFWQPLPDPVAYSTLLSATYTAVKRVDPTVIVLTGGTAPAGASLDAMSSDGRSYSPYRWLRLLYENGARASFDAVATHPYASFPYSPATSWGNTMQMPAMYQLMKTWGDGAKKLWGTEAGYPTGTASGAVGEATQATYIRDYLTAWRGWAFVGPLFLYQLRDRGTTLASREDNFGILHHDFSKKPAYDVFDQGVG